MNTTNLLVVAGIIPAIILCIYVYKKDKVDKEPIGLLLKLLVFGAVSCYPAAYIENFIGDIIRIAFSPDVIKSGGEIIVDNSVKYSYNFVYYFFCVAVAEEGLKWLIVHNYTGQDKNFNCFFDGMIYAIFVSLGFAGLENVFYVLQYGWYNAIMRAIVSVPGHMFFAVFMGYYYSNAVIYKKANALEKDLIIHGRIANMQKQFGYKRYMALSFIVPVTLHGTYNFLCSSDNFRMVLLFYVYILILYRYCFKKIRFMSQKDNYHNTYVNYLVYTKYPELVEHNNEFSIIKKG